MEDQISISYLSDWAWKMDTTDTAKSASHIDLHLDIDEIDSEEWLITKLR